MKINIKSISCLLLAAVIWGFAFVAQDVASQTLQSFTITGLRCLIGFVILVIIISVRAKINKESIIPSDKGTRKKLLNVGTICGICFAVAYNLQQFGIAIYPENIATSGRAAFLTGLYVIFVPLIGIIFMKNKISLNIVISVILATIGLYLLCFTEGIKNIYLGDLIIILCGVFFALQIILVDKYNDGLETLRFVAMQMLVCGIISILLAFIFEKPTMSAIINTIIPLLFLGVFACVCANVLQTLGQKYSNNPTMDSIVMSFETVFAVIGGAIFGETLGINEIIGCIIMFSAIVLSQIPIKFKKEKIKTNGE